MYRVVRMEEHTPVIFKFKNKLSGAPLYYIILFLVFLFMLYQVEK